MKIEHPQPRDIAALRQLWKDAFGDPDSYLDLFFSTAFFPDHSLCLWEDGCLRSAAYWLDCQIAGRSAAYIYAVATAEGSRGRGFCRALMKEIHCTLFNRGYCGSILVPGDKGLRQMYTTMGYRDFGSVRRFSPSSGRGQMQKISREEFARLRRLFLPENAVIQEGTQLLLLDAVAEFYRGDGFLATLSRENGEVLELLGDDTAAGFGEISRHPFAMYRPLTEEIFPTYFAFAFD
jgi:hypothetical protein